MGCGVRGQRVMLIRAWALQIGPSAALVDVRSLGGVMPARTRKIRHDAETRLKIQISQLVNRLTDHVFGRVEMSKTQVIRTPAEGVGRDSRRLGLRID